MHNYTFWGGRELKTTTFFIFSWTSIESFRIQLQKKKYNIWWIERDRIGAKTFEAARLHFLSDVFVAVAVVVVWAPYASLSSTSQFRTTLTLTIIFHLLFERSYSYKLFCLSFGRQTIERPTAGHLPPLKCFLHSGKCWSLDAAVCTEYSHTFQLCYDCKMEATKEIKKFWVSFLWTKVIKNKRTLISFKCKYNNDFCHLFIKLRHLSRNESTESENNNIILYSPEVTHA